jgi:hypothetical protein
VGKTGEFAEDEVSEDEPDVDDEPDVVVVVVVVVEAVEVVSVGGGGGGIMLSFSSMFVRFDSIRLIIDWLE